MAKQMSAVMTGRSMKRRVHELHLGAGKEAQLAVGDDGIAGRDALLDHHLPAEGAAGCDQADRHLAIRPHDVDELALLSGLDSFGGHNGSSLNGVEGEDGSYELARPECGVPVVDGGLKVNGAGGGVHRVVDDGEGAGRTAGGVVLGEHANGERVDGVEAAHGGEMLFRHVEVDENGGDLMDHHQRNVVGLDQVSGVDQQVAGASGQGRADLAVIQVEFGGTHGGEVAIERRLGANDAGLSGARRFTGDIGAGLSLVGLRAGDDARLGEFGVAIGVTLVESGLGCVASEVGLHLADLGAVARHVGFGLAKGFLVRSRVDLKQQITFGNILAFGEADAQELP